MKSEDQLAIFSSFGFTDFFGFVSLYFSRKKLVLINLNAIFPEKFAVTPVINIYSSGNYSCTWIKIICIFNYLPNKVNCILKPTFFLNRKNPKKIINLFSLRSRYRRLANRKKFILPLGNYIKTLKEHNFLSNVQFFKVQNNRVEIWVFDVTRGTSI